MGNPYVLLFSSSLILIPYCFCGNRLASVQEQRLPPNEPPITEESLRSAEISVPDKVSLLIMNHDIKNKTTKHTHLTNFETNTPRAVMPMLLLCIKHRFIPYHT